MIKGLAERLAELAAQQQTISYGDLARGLSVPGPGSIAKLTLALEDLMVEDAQAGRVFRAALCRARTGPLPARGFFEAAQRLGRFDGQDGAGFAAAERAALFKAAALG